MVDILLVQIRLSSAHLIFVRGVLCLNLPRKQGRLRYVQRAHHRKFLASHGNS
jgi:hypothetical protein